MKNAEIFLAQASGRGVRLPIVRAVTCIGSNPTNDVVIPDPDVPDVAAILVQEGDGPFFLKRIGQAKLRIDGAPCENEAYELHGVNTIELGSYTLTLSLRREAPASQQRTDVLETQDDETRVLTLSYAGKHHRLRPDRPFHIGSHQDNDLAVDDPFVSGFHCRIAFDGQAWIATDLGSTNGMQINNVRVREAELPIPCALRFGKAEAAVFSGSMVAGAGSMNSDTESFFGMVAKSDNMRAVFGLINRVANAKEPVLIQAESGSGKELVAQAIHKASSRSAHVFLALNCGALTSSLIESELFGHVRGAFTGAITDKMGAFEAANQGTLFLDEIGELPLDLQPKLLRVLENHAVRRLGGTKEVTISTRVVAATHRNLLELVHEGKFREDLFHRLFVLSIRVPPLRERPEDIAALAQHFVRTQSDNGRTLSADACQVLLDYTWPGNVRELRNVLVRALLMTDTLTIGPEHLEFLTNAFTTPSQDARRSVRLLEEKESRRIEEALAQADGNRAEAARLMGLSKSTFHDRLRRFGFPYKI
jgi:two-component system, NtrC family, response regulator HydG